MEIQLMQLKKKLQKMVLILIIMEDTHGEQTYGDYKVYYKVS